MTTENYVSNKDLLEEFEKYEESGVWSERMGEMVLLIASNYATKGNFAGYTWIEDMIGEAVLTCFKYMKNFDRTKSSNPFAYITQICRNAFINYIKKQQRHSVIKDVCYNNGRILQEEEWYSSQGINYEKLV